MSTPTVASENANALAILVLIIGPRFLNESNDPNATGRIDPIGVPVGTAAVAFIMFGIVQSESWGIGDPRVIALVVVGLALIPVLIQRSRVHPEPMINMELFQYASFQTANIGVVFYGLAFTAGLLTNSLMLQDLWEQPIRTVGLAFVPAPLLAGIVSPLTGRYADRFGHRWLLAAGGLFIAYGLGVSVVLTLIATAATSGGDTTVRGIRWAWSWSAVCYFLSAVTVAITFPRGSSSDRAL